ncbi:lipid droplet-associated hydrolase [Phascolarctos cinereus]|nr:lipid droplet-associated hydrolase isoform X2 [Phascolarctos cinereus]XP_020823098.1 lipid droplet-associated hydrolase isoform X2 [Phascolarctos cinereus]XP_020823099.1 lipid droplet-associated hydrolase isoform X2 [Phascolarctos cinereus]XP_020823100.1 lipid droplet-associated hydrolase isoform X2 [Phascolarctos cinereus]
MDVTENEDVLVHDEFLVCGGVVTHVLKCGPWSDLFSTKDSPKLLVLIITGNPGVPAFYTEFVKALYLSLQKRYPVWVISHAGHVSAPRGVKVDEEVPKDPSPRKLDDAVGLEGQVEHKLAFLRRCVPATLRLVLISHSVGSYILLEMMKRAPQLPVLRSLLLFPTIERIAKTPNGQLATPLLCWLRYALYVPIYIGLSLLPARVQAILANLILQSLKMENAVTSRHVMNSVNMDCIANAMYLGSQEMRTILERDNDTIQKHLKKLTFYYGTSDLWCPIQFYEDIKKDFPSGDIKLCEKGINHAFVMSSNQEMATMIADWLKDDLAKI